MQEDKKSKPKKGFLDFLSKFPEIELPVSLTEEARHLFSLQNKPIPEELIHQFLIPTEEEAPDEFSEFMACFQLPGTGAFHALVFWRAGLMNYHYSLITFNNIGEFIDKRVIAGTFAEKNTVTQSIATIQENLQIIIASGQGDAEEEFFDAGSTTTYVLEILLDGSIRNV